jgi:uncharacterized membrane protein
VAGGGLLLFGTNLVGITLAGAVIFLLLGFRPVKGVRDRESQLRRGLVVTMLLLLVVSLPLGFMSGRTVQATQEEEVVRRVLTRELEAIEGAALVGYELERQGEQVSLTVTIYASTEVDEDVASRLAAAVTEELGRDVRLHLVAIPVSESSAP